MFENIPGYDTWRKIEKINRGWSDDIKYYIETKDNEKLTLRTSNIKNYEQKKKEYEMITKYAELGFPMSKPVDFGNCNHGQDVYMILTWVDGEDLEIALPKLSKDEQYRLGRQAGNILKLIHSIQVPKDEVPPITKIPKKLAQIESYEKSNVRIPNDEGTILFIKENLHKIWQKPVVYQHGDFHPGNLILTKDNNIGVIDFNRWEIGDPYEEFYKIEIFGTRISVPYCIGQIDSYFDDMIPDDFWEVQSIYVAHASLYSIKWVEKFGQIHIDEMVGFCKNSFKHYNNFKTLIPNWYKKVMF